MNCHNKALKSRFPSELLGGNRRFNVIPGSNTYHRLICVYRRTFHRQDKLASIKRKRTESDMGLKTYQLGRSNIKQKFSLNLFRSRQTLGMLCGDNKPRSIFRKWQFKLSGLFGWAVIVWEYANSPSDNFELIGVEAGCTIETLRTESDCFNISSHLSKSFRSRDWINFTRALFFLGIILSRQIMALLEKFHRH